ncbi:hypothetical protein B0J14DRAFT_569205 [Halenospora varia]|nr:hypothetical protein B0J14DRAFT_569205 [Halenospora varia]
MLGMPMSNHLSSLWAASTSLRVGLLITCIGSDRVKVTLEDEIGHSKDIKRYIKLKLKLSLDKEYSSCWDKEDMDLDRMKTFVRSSKGLAEVTRNKVAEVQFIHQSVRDFLFGKYEGQSSEGSGDFVGYSHGNFEELLRGSIERFD